MPIKDFQVNRGADPDDVDLRRQRALIGGSLAQRRLHGTPTPLGGRFVLDPVFRLADVERLREACAPVAGRPLVVEIGFQFGEFAAAFCKARPNVQYVGFEVRKHFCLESDKLLQEQEVGNALLALVDAREMLQEVLVPGTLDQLLVFFPDPWWKPRHAKKRLLNADFVGDTATWLRPGGRLLLKTDVEGYADWAEATLAAHPAFAVSRLADPAADLPFTLRERRCRFHGLPTWAVQGERR